MSSATIEDEFGYEIENCVRTGDDWRCGYALDALSGLSGRMRVQQRGVRCWAAATEDGPNSPSQSEDGFVSGWQFFKAM
jgi:hypothetical protein